MKEKDITSILSSRGAIKNYDYIQLASEISSYDIHEIIADLYKSAVFISEIYAGLDDHCGYEVKFKESINTLSLTIALFESGKIDE